MKPPRLSSRQGSAIILVLWCLLILGMAVFGVIEMVQLSVERTSHQQLVAEARALALTGVAVGSHPQILKDDPILTQETGSRRGYKVKIENEGAKLNVNFLIQTQHKEVLFNLFRQWGLDNQKADRVADCLYDWVTPGDLKSLNGAKADDYARAKLPQRPTGKPFATLDEMDLVLGMDLIDKIHPNWRESFTLWSAGPLNIKEAPANLIAAVFGLQPGQLSFFTKSRDGKDGIPGTLDDGPLPDMKTFQAELGLTDETFDALSNLISTDDPSRRIESVGQAEGTQVMITVVAKVNTTPLQYLSWTQQ